MKEIREYHTDSCGLFFTSEKMLYQGDSDYQKIEIFENRFFGRVLMLDGLVQTPQKDEHFYHEMLAHPAMVAHPHPENVLIIGGGDGGVLREVLRYPVHSAVLVEIDALVLEAADKYFPWLSETRKDSRAEIVVDDGNAYVENVSRAFDVVLIDSSDPVGPSSILHARDFYTRLKKRLNAGAVVSAQIGSPFFHPEILSGKYDFLSDIFPYVHYYLGPVPSYPGGMWCYAFMSEKTDPLSMSRESPQGLKYYNQDVHRAAFALSESLRKRLAVE